MPARLHAATVAAVVVACLLVATDAFVKDVTPVSEREYSDGWGGLNTERRLIRAWRAPKATEFILEQLRARGGCYGCYRSESGSAQSVDYQSALDWVGAEGIKVFLVGGFVRDSLQGIKSKDLDVGVSLDDRLASPTDAVSGLGYLNILGTFGIGNGHHVVKVGIAGAGHARNIVPLEFVPAAANVFSDILWKDFTVNSVYYDYSRGYFLDPTGRGMDDTASWTLRIACYDLPQTQWGEWVTIAKLQRFFHMALKGYRPDHLTMKFIMEEVVKTLEDNEKETLFYERFALNTLHAGQTDVQRTYTLKRILLLMEEFYNEVFDDKHGEASKFLERVGYQFYQTLAAKGLRFDATIDCSSKKMKCWGQRRVKKALRSNKQYRWWKHAYPEWRLNDESSRTCAGKLNLMLHNVWRLHDKTARSLRESGFEPDVHGLRAYAGEISEFEDRVPQYLYQITAVQWAAQQFVWRTAVVMDEIRSILGSKLGQYDFWGLHQRGVPGAGSHDSIWPDVENIMMDPEDVRAMMALAYDGGYSSKLYKEHIPEAIRAVGLGQVKSRLETALKRPIALSLPSDPCHPRGSDIIVNNRGDTWVQLKELCADPKRDCANPREAYRGQQQYFFVRAGNDQSRSVLMEDARGTVLNNVLGPGLNDAEDKWVERNRRAGDNELVVPWRSGGDTYQMNLEEEPEPFYKHQPGFVEQAEGNGFGTIAGPSGTTEDHLLFARQVLGFTTDELYLLRLAIIAWVIPTKGHSLYEVLAGAEGQGLEMSTMYGNLWRQLPRHLLPVDFRWSGGYMLDRMLRHQRSGNAELGFSGARFKQYTGSFSHNQLDGFVRDLMRDRERMVEVEVYAVESNHWSVKEGATLAGSLIGKLLSHESTHLDETVGELHYRVCRHFAKKVLNNGRQNGTINCVDTTALAVCSPPLGAAAGPSQCSRVPGNQDRTRAVFHIGRGPARTNPDDGAVVYRVFLQLQD